MSEAYLMSMPVIINCLGGEMIYILCSRLKAQNITLDKSIRVIKDIGNTGLNSNNHSIYIFGGNDSGSASYKSSIKLYEFKISDGDTLTHEFIPCYRKSDGEIGLYDKVENKFYTNAGTGTFIKGNDV